jgi:hypothetical protein
LLHQNGVAFFRDCYLNLASYMKDYIARVKNMQVAYTTLAEALIQQRFVVEVGSYIMRCVANVPLQQLPNGHKQTPISMFSILFCRRFVNTLKDSESVQISVELESNGTQLPGTSRRILANYYPQAHINSIQRVAEKMFTEELESLAVLLSKCDQFKEQGATCSNDEWQSACKQHIQLNIRQLNELVTAAVVQLDKKHGCATKHCDCCPSSTVVVKKTRV